MRLKQDFGQKHYQLLFIYLTPASPDRLQNNSSSYWQSSNKLNYTAASKRLFYSQGFLEKNICRKTQHFLIESISLPMYTSCKIHMWTAWNICWELAPLETGESLPIHWFITTTEAKYAFPVLTLSHPVKWTGHVPEEELHNSDYSQSAYCSCPLAAYSITASWK